ncbi:MAG: hypothetical protein ACOCZ6_05630, partial [Nanoarchaeota archaeon]
MNIEAVNLWEYNGLPNNIESFINKGLLPYFMSKSLNDRYILDMKKSEHLIREYQACGLNSIITILESFVYMQNVNIEEIKRIFKYDDEGIHNMRYVYRKFNTYLAQQQVPLKFNIRKFSSLQDIYKALHMQGVVPVFFKMKILHFTKKLYRNLDYQLSFGDVFQDDNKHILIFTGYDRKGEKIYFIDPSYQLPWINSKASPRTHYFELPQKVFYECIKNIKVFMEV